LVGATTNELPISPDFLVYLETTQADLDKREKDCTNMDCTKEGFEFYRKFNAQAGHQLEG